LPSFVRNRADAFSAHGIRRNAVSKQYDLAVIGTGTAATVAALRVREAGWRVAVIDFRPFGGTCALRGCDPKKLLIGGADVVGHAHRMRGKGVAGDAHIDWQELMAFKRSFTDPIPENRERFFIGKGIDTYHGRARFTGGNSLQAGDEMLEAKYILIASGAEPVKLGIPGEEHLITNEEFLSLDAMPHRIALIGGGYIASEFSHIAAHARARVTILHRGERMLKQFDPDLVGWLMESFEARGIDVRTRAPAEAIEKTGNAYITYASADGQRISVDADLVVHAAGRRPAFDTLDLQAAGVAVENGRLKLNEYLQSETNPAVYAAGDAAQMGPPLTPVSSYDANLVAANLLEGNRHKPEYRGVPSVAFTIPPIAAIGLSEAQARNKGLKFHMNSLKASDWFTARQAAEPVYGFKVMVEEQTDHVLGAHLVGPHAEEVINLFALAIRHDLTAADLKTMMFAFPSSASDIGSMV
jgi:glutathione reductase (NADPH)